jgi:hypothetical protein
MSNPLEVIKEHKSQLLFFVLLVGIVAPVIIYLMYTITIVRAWMFSGKFPEPNIGWPMLSDLWITGVGAIASWALNIFINKFAWKFYYDRCKEKNDEEVRIAKTQKMIDNTFRAVFFTIASVWGIYLGRTEEYFPWILGGSGDFSHMYVNYPSC